MLWERVGVRMGGRGVRMGGVLGWEVWMVGWEGVDGGLGGSEWLYGGGCWDGRELVGVEGGVGVGGGLWDGRGVGMGGVGGRMEGGWVVRWKGVV